MTSDPSGTPEPPPSRAGRVVLLFFLGFIVLVLAAFAGFGQLLKGSTHKRLAPPRLEAPVESTALQLNLDYRAGDLRFVPRGGQLLRQSAELIELQLPFEVSNTAPDPRPLPPERVPTLLANTGRAVHAERGPSLDPMSGLTLGRRQTLMWTLSYLLHPADLPVRLSTPAGQFLVDFTGAKLEASEVPARAPAAR